ncbi:MAG: mechanosensitive ion channel [Myxococcota bacterium]|nr:mechanosensitive ion channel [Myxococcota bacterium]
MDFESYWDVMRAELLVFASAYGLQVIGALLIAIFGWIVAGWASRRTRLFAERSSRVDKTLAPLLAKAVRMFVLAVVLIAVLDNLGVDTAALFALLGAAGLAIGLALKDTVADVAAGIVLLALRPFSIGEAVMIGSTGGTVEEIGFFQTRLTSFDGVPVVLNNSSVRTTEIQNFSRAKLRRIELTIGIAYGADVNRGIEVIRRVVDAEARVLVEPEPLIDVTNLGDSSVDLLVRVWSNAADFFPTKLALARQIKEALDAADISIPFPQREIRIVGGSVAA